ncbi:ferritin [Nocardia camponoti]|uniref:Ferritin BfrB n=1 Tax=Nocardia camponoti TaxID=1616106 RepID=A0A917QKN4_9NOCA|nr:ferritin-like domain-containing protein [Nocardia camponoti]GGK55274.1 ferritin BfrB [Nocardia camponoti]
MATDGSFAQLLRTQIRNQLTLAQQYLAAAVYYDSLDLPQLAGQTYPRSTENHGHAMRMVQYLLDRDEPVSIGGIDEVVSEFDSPRAAMAYLLECEHVTTKQITELAAAARTANDYLGEQFMQWFLKEQVADVAELITLVRVLDRDGNLFDVELFIERELTPVVGIDNTAPRMAGT